MNHSLRLVSFALASMLVACASSVTGTGDGGDVTQSTDVTSSDRPFVCPADPFSLVGHACSDPNASCGACSDPCSFCNMVRCDGSTWQMLEIFPGQCDAGVDDVTVQCGMETCSAGEICVHTVASGGPCQPVGDGGCGPNQRNLGTCCVAYSESWRCTPPPSGCSPTLSCGCSTSLCTIPDSGTTCPCQSASDHNVECGCFFP